MRRLWGTLIAVVLASPGEGDSPQKEESLPCKDLRWLVPAPAFSGLRCYMFQGTPEATATVKEPYPASVTLGAVQKRLRELGWKPLEEDFLNPGLRSAHVSGWGSFLRGEKEQQRVNRWYAQWEDVDRNVVVYAFDYLSEPWGTIESNEGTLTAKFLPCSAVNSMLHEVGLLQAGEQRCGNAPAPKD